MKTKILALILLLNCLIAVHTARGDQTDAQVNRIYQFFAPSVDDKNRPNLGAYLWIPPNTPKIRAVMVAIHNGLPINVLQSAPVRAVCRKHGIAQILMTPWAKDIGSVMLKDLTYDVTDPQRTAVYDSYLQRLADISGHPELVDAPIVPLAHSAFCDFPFDAAVRKPEQCLGAIPIKAGLPDVYNSFAPGSKARSPNPNLCLRNVPILFVNSGSQETVSWSAYPHGLNGAGVGSYRRDHDDNTGTEYEPRDEMFGMCWEMMCGHFDMLPRDYQFVADWLDAVATARLPATPGEPMKNPTLRDGWLMDPQIPPTGDLPKDYPIPAPYLQYTGHRNQALWFPNQKLAETLFELGRDEPRKKIEMFTFLDSQNQPISLAHNALAPLPDAQTILHDDGLLVLTTYHFTSPPDICVNDRDHKMHPEEPFVYANVLFPGKSTMPVSDIPLQFDPNSGAFELLHSEQFKDDRGVTETRFTLRLIRHRIDPDAGFAMSFVRVYDSGDDQFAAAGRTCQISCSPSDAGKNASTQTVDFPPLPDAPATSAKIELNAKSSSGLPVDYFVFKGPGIIQSGAFIPTEVPAGASKPIEVTIGAYQVGLFKQNGGIKPSPTVYRTFHLTP
jgi:hypothetical protein